MKKFYINDNGTLLDDTFLSIDEAFAYIANICDEDAYLMKVIELDESEAWFIGFIQATFEHEAAKKVYELDDDYKKILAADAERLGITNWVTEKYLNYFYETATQNGDVVGLDDYIKMLIKDIDFVQDYDSALEKYNK